MKKVTVKTLSGQIICSESTLDAKSFVASGILDGKWGNPNEITIDVIDITKDAEDKESRMKNKRMGLVRDYSALNPKRKERLRMAIDKFMLANFPVDVGDV